MHPDHYTDLIPLRYGRRYGDPLPPIEVWLPPGGAAQLERVAAAVSRSQPFWSPELQLREYAADTPLDLADLRATPRPVEHGVPAFAFVVQDDAGASLTYSGDSTVCDGLARASMGADTLIAECTYGGGAPIGKPRTHLTAREAGEIAHAAGVRRLVLSHFWPTADRERCRAEAAAAFAGDVILAAPHCAFEVGPP